jgi:hypothetical protein
MRLMLPFAQTSVACICGALAVSAAAGSGVPPLLDRALLKMAANQERWASTWTSVYSYTRDHPQGATVIHTDPSLPYPEQRHPVLIAGHPPSEKILGNFRQ